MNWINGFEILCYIITFILLADIIFRKSWNDLYLFISAAFAGFALELLAVRVTGIYHYSSRFLINIGNPPFQFPLFGGLMWGGLTVYSLRISEKLGLDYLWTSLIAGWLIVSMDLLLDVVAIRLDGGFWSWEGSALSLEINHHVFMSVIWVNFLGYLFENPFIVFLFLKTKKMREKLSSVKKLLLAIAEGAGGVIFVGICSSLALILNRFTDDWFSCIAFLLLWNIILIKILKVIFSEKDIYLKAEKGDVPLLIYWAVIYIFCIAALIHLEINKQRPLYFSLGIILFLFVYYLILRKVKKV